jgi:hypothetical protein
MSTANTEWNTNWGEEAPVEEKIKESPFTFNGSRVKAAKKTKPEFMEYTVNLPWFLRSEMMATSLSVAERMEHENIERQMRAEYERTNDNT